MDTRWNGLFTHMKHPRPNKIVPKEDVTVSTDTLNCFDNKAYPALARGDNAPSRLAAKQLQPFISPWSHSLMV